MGALETVQILVLQTSKQNMFNNLTKLTYANDRYAIEPLLSKDPTPILSTIL